MGSRSPNGRGNFEGEGADQDKAHGHYAMNCAKTAAPIKMPFGMWVRIGPRNHVLDGIQITHVKGQF